MLKKISLLAAGLALCAAAWAGPKVELQTNMGRIVLELDQEKAPVTVKNFLTYVRDKHYDGTIFHRVIPGFMIQGGGYTAKMEEKSTNSPIANEGRNGLKNLRGTIAMARRGDPNSATAQFFINHKDNASLDYPSYDGFGYAVFGRVVQGMDVVDKIAQVPTTTRTMHENVPVEPVVIQTAKIISDK